MNHTFHIPVLGLGYSIDTPLKVARYGISSVVSIVDDELIERMRAHISETHKEPYQPILKTDTDARAKRITNYLNLLNKLVTAQISALKVQDFDKESDLCKYFDLLPEDNEWKYSYNLLLKTCPGYEKKALEEKLKNSIKPGRIDVNIMSKVDKANYIKGTYLGDENTDALAALRGFANSNLNSSVVISAGLNPRLFSYLEEFHDFQPLEDGTFPKQIILKVSDYRSALIQAKVLAKKGLWVSEFRVESGLNCGGHAFATDGFLLGPILQEFKDNKVAMYNELFQLYSQAYFNKTSTQPPSIPAHKITAQGGIGTAEEHQFLLNYYELDAAGWGSPFLLVPEATCVDEKTLNDLETSNEQDYYISNASPLGILFNNFKKSSAEIQRQERVDSGKPGSPCTKKYLCTNTEFTTEPICTASIKYQHLKIKQLEGAGLSPTMLKSKIALVTEKLCLCVGLCTSAYKKYDLLKSKENHAVSICPGPNLAYFDQQYTLKQMIDHIYGRNNILNGKDRPNLFNKEFALYVDYLKKEMDGLVLEFSEKKSKYVNKFQNQLNNGIEYYKTLMANVDPMLTLWNKEQINKFEAIAEGLKQLLKNTTVVS
ncbi:MAG: hypothetical protein H7223_11715 [Pedobacter sp.]|nr:hypothetical protein [Pedobacter sp.]